MKFPSSNSKDPLEASLGRWFASQRVAYHENRLSPLQIKKLEQIPGWSWSIYSDQWDKTCEKVKQFIVQKKRLPLRYSKDPKEKRLGLWVKKQRQAHRRRKLSQERIEKLEKIPGWSWDTVAQRWSTQCSKVLTFAKENGKLPSSRSENQKERTLGQWSGTQRQGYREGKLSQKQIEKLEQIPGWVWNGVVPAQWSSKYAILSSFVAQNEKIPSAESKNEEEKIIGRWAGKQRTDKREGKLSQEKIEKLERIPGWKWDYGVKSWDTTHEELLVESQKSGKPPPKHDKDPHRRFLANWAAVQRRKYRKGRLSSAQISKLEQIPGWDWKPRVGNWDTSFAEVLAYVRRKHILPSCTSKDLQIKTLGYWCAAQRSNGKSGKLSQKRVRMLERIPGWRWNGNERSGIWSFLYGELNTFMLQRRKIPSTSSKDITERTIGRWSAGKRRDKRLGRLSAVQVNDLERIPGWKWNPYDDNWSENYQKLCQGELSFRASWVLYQRKRYRDGQLHSDKIEKLEQISGWWWTK